MIFVAVFFIGGLSIRIVLCCHEYFYPCLSLFFDVIEFVFSKWQANIYREENNVVDLFIILLRFSR